MYKVEVETNNESQERYFKSIDEAQSYITHIGLDEKLKPNFEFSGFTRKINGMVYSVSITTLTTTKLHKAWNEDYSFFEIFDDALYLKPAWDFYIKDICGVEDNVDSFRVGKLDDAESMKEYEELKTCCGSDDTEVDINRTKYMFGCNFGH